MKQMKLVLKLATTFFAAFLIFATLSCEVGLGSAVDTERPDLSITYPPKGAIIRDSFTLAGTVSDDVGVTFINVVLTHKTLKTEYVYKSSEGQVNIATPAKGWSGGTTWTATIGKKTEGQKLFNGWDLPDGDYFIDVEAADVEGSVYDRRSITIDNTPPVCIIENLTSLGTQDDADKLSTFGQKINLSGKVKDDTGVSKVFFDAYDENKTFVGSGEMDYDMSSDGILLAQYKAGTPANEKEKLLAQNYNMIYGLQANQKLPEKIDPAKDIKTRYITFRMADNAKIYNAPVFTNSESSDGNTVEGTGDGNVSTEVYLNTQAFGLENITIDDLGEYRKQLKEDAEMNAKIGRIASSSIASTTLGSDGDFSKILKMQINPEIDPKWYVGSYDINGTDYEQSFIGSTLTVMFSAGYDNVQFKPSNIRIILAKLAEENGAYTKILASDDELRNQTEDTENVIVLKNYGGSEELTLNLTQPVTLSSDLIKSQERYRIMVFGKDGPLGDGLDFKEKNNSWYGIKATKNATPPTITILNTNEDSWIGPNKTEIPFKFTIEVDGDQLVNDEPTMTVSVTDSNGNKKEYSGYDWGWSSTEDGKKYSSKEGKKYTFDWKLQNLPMPDGVGNYKLIIKVEARDNNEGYASKTFKLNIDKEKPKTTITNAIPYINDGSKDYLNGTVEIPVTFKDNQGVESYKASYKVGEVVHDFATEEIALGDADANGNRSGTITLNTLEITDKSEIILTVIATDIYGNESEPTTKKYTVDQETDKPKLEFGNLDSTADYEGNSFGLTSGNKISASVSDDDGIGEVKVRVKNDVASWTKTEADAWTDTSEWKSVTVNNSQISWNFYDSGLIKTDGKYQVQFAVKDSVGTLSTSTYTSPEYNILVDSSAPVFGDVTVAVDEKPVTADSNCYYIPKGKSAAVSLKVEEGSLNKVTVKVNNGAAAEVSKSLADGSTTDWNVTYIWTPGASESSGGKELTFEATDASGNSTEKTVSLYYDANAPEIELELEKQITTYKADKSVDKGNNVNGVITITGNIGDNDAIASTEVKILEGETEVNNILVTPTGKTNSNTEFTYTVDTTTLTDKHEYKLSVKTTDRAGNETTEEIPFYVNQATDNPTITFNNADATKEASKNVFGIEGWKINGIVEDDDGAVASLEVGYKETENDIETVVFNKIAVETSGAFEYEIPESSRTSGVESVTFTVVDKKSNPYKETQKTAVITLNYVVDKEVPKFGEIKLYNGEKSGENTTYDETGTVYYSGMFAKACHKFEFPVSDDNEVTKVEVKVWQTEPTDAGEPTDWTDISKTTLSENKDKVAYTRSAEDGTFKIKFRLTDKYGHQSSVRELVYKVDTESPDFTSITTTVDGKSDFGTWFNKSLLSVKILDIQDTNLSADVSVAVTGATELSDSFQMNVANGSPKTGNFNRAITFADGTSNVAYTFKDEAGNTNVRSFSVNVDTVAPAVSDPSITGLSSGVTKEKTITANFTVSDKNGELATSKLKNAVFGPSANFADSEKYGDVLALDDADSQRVTQSIDISSLEDGTYQVWVRVTDNAENTSQDYEIGSFIIDRNPPVVKIKSHNDNAKVNNKITLSGTVTDENLSDAMPVLKCGETVLFDDGASPKVNLITGMTCTVDGTGTTRAWKFEGLDTTNTNIGSGNKTFTVEFADKAGTKGSLSRTLDVDQDSDRPIVTLSQININGTTTLSTGKISWDVTDDDGAPEYVKITVEKKDGDTWTNVVRNQPITPTSGKYGYPSDGTLDDGNYRLSFEIKDGAGTTFTSGAENTLSQPKVEGVGGSQTGGQISFAVDGTPPTINSVKIYMETGKDSSGDAIYEEVGTEINGGFYGGTKKQKGKIKIDATDNVVSDSNALVYNLKLDGSEKKNIGTEYLIDFSEIASGGLTMTFEVYDNSGVAGTKTATVFVDNLPPNVEGKAVTNMKPASSTEVTGTVEVTANISDDTTARSGIDPETVAYYIPKNDGTVAGKETDPTIIAEKEWTYAKSDSGKENFEVTDVLVKFTLSELTDTSGGEPKIVASYKGYENSSNEGIYDIPVWIKLSDNVGNTSYVTGNTIKYNPDADRPQVKILDPVHSDSVGDKGYITLGGNIRISGSAEDDEGIEGIYVQYDINGDGLYNDTDKTWLSSKGYEISTIPKSGDWGVKAKNTMSWQATFKATDLGEDAKNLQIGNASNEYNKTLNIRVCAVDTDSSKPLVSAWSEELHVSVNNGIPSFNNMQVAQYSDDTYATEIQRFDYEEDIYISGSNWRLEGFIGDDGGINKIETSGSQSITLSDNSALFVAYEADLKGYKIYIPINEKKFKLQIVAYDNTSPTNMKNSASYSVLTDNDAPKFDGNDEDDLVLYLNEYGEYGEEISENTKVQNSNGWTTIASKVSDTESGFEKAVFYIKRTGTGGNRVYNIMQEHGNDGSANRTDLAESEEADKVYINGDGLPVLKKTNVTRSSTTTIGISGIGSDTNIKKGGLVLIGGFYRTIASVETNVVTLAEEVDTTYTDAYFVYGAVVDHSGETLNEDKYVSGDDGDRMAESITKAGTDYIWDATFDSTHIPDGPVEIHVVVFDKVGNKRHGSVKARISNNSPRLARVKLGTDLNGDGNIEDFETTTFVANSKYTSSTALAEMSRDDFADIWNLDTRSEDYGGDYWKIKNKLKVTPEFVGGTGSIYYVFSKAAGIGNNTHLETAETASSPTLLNDSITLENTNIGTGSDNQVNTYRFSFWDQTEETTPGKDSGWAVLNAELYQDITDDNRPESIIHPFFWKEKGEGSVSNPYNSIQWNDSEALGHIELEGDLVGTQAYTDYGDDPKVSGKIVLRGTVYDETRLTEVQITSNDTSILGNKTLTAKYNTSTKAWTTTGNADGYTFTVKDLNGGIKQIGHLVEWTLEVNTENVSGVAKTDVTFTVQGNDGTLSAATGSQTSFDTSVYATAVQAASGKYYTEADGAKNEDKTKLAPSTTIRKHSPRQFNLVEGSSTVYEYRFGTTNHYQMDVMPYVTKVTTSLSSKDVNNPSKYDRTSLGHYPVQSVVSNVQSNVLHTTSSETVTLSGFNLGGTGTITVSAADLITGEYSAKVNDIDIINNINNNDAKGDATTAGSNYANWYNRMANGDNNNNLTDDIVFDVWEFNDRVAEPNSASIEGTVMKVNSSSNMIQYAYSDGTYMVMGDGTTNSGRRVLLGYDTFQGPSIGLHIDASGNTFGCGHPSDTNGNNAIDFFRLITSKWGFDTGKHTTKKNVSVEGIGEKTDKTNTVIERQCIWSPSMASTVTDTTVTDTTVTTSENLYMAYYDQLWKEIRFRAGTVPATCPSDSNAFGMFYDRGVPVNGGADTSNELEKLQGAKVIATSANSGRYVSLAARNDGGNDIVCIVWFDAQANKLKYAYDTVANSDIGTTSKWNFTNQKTLFDSVGGGQYCQIAFDANGGVHVAAYAGNGHVYYAYASSYDDKFTESRVDATDGVGQNLTLDVALNADADGNPIPYIGYYSTIGKPKYAYLTDDAAAKGNYDGVDTNGRYTGNWNISVLPTKSALYINPEDKINVGVWKDSDGKLTYSTTDGKEPDTNKSNIGTSTLGQNSTTGGKTYGNGTSNGVLLYQIVDSKGTYVNCLESAQMR